MTISSVIALITGVLQFPKEVLALINALKITPAEQHAALVQAIQNEAENLKNSGRPTW